MMKTEVSKGRHTSVFSDEGGVIKVKKKKNEITTITIQE